MYLYHGGEGVKSLNNKFLMLQKAANIPKFKPKTPY